jgi:murein DD-endopeptidase MepM/ murein hydrolase activator NlpD
MLVRKVVFNTHPATDNLVETIDTLSDGPKEYFYGYDLDSFEVVKSKVKNGQTFSDLLGAYGISYNTILELERNNNTSFSARNIIAGKSFAVLLRKDTVNYPAYFIYEANVIDYYILALEGTPGITKVSREVEVRKMEVEGVITSSLYHAFESRNLSISLAMELSEIFAWTVDFYKVQKGDAFKAIYYEKFVEEKSVGIERVEAAVFTHYQKPYYAFRFKEDGKFSYFDENGQSAKKLFLKAPLKFSRISSKYNLKRFHPVLKRTKPHLGTDYAAPTGTPIMTVGDGTVIEAGYTAGNGNYVKVKHNSVYTTQYLHMSKFGAGIRKGKRVSQGDVIGYVGSTGLATGPHLCFRFWKNGKQVDPLKEKSVQTTPVHESNKAAFKAVVDSLKPQLDKI